MDDRVEEELPKSVVELISNPQNDNNSQQLLAKGNFEQGDSTYSIDGEVFLSQINGQLNLTFKDFKVTNGPNLFVYAVKAKNTDNATVKQAVKNGDFINLADFKGNLGDQNYSLSTNLDHTEYNIISIWCRRFSRNFGSAHLE